MARNRRLTDYVNVDIIVKRVDKESGAFGDVYFGPDARSGGKWAALKTLRPEVVRAAPTDYGLLLVELFTQESLHWMSLWPHANILPARGVTEIDSQVFIILPYAEGGSLHSWIYPTARLGFFPWSRQRLSLNQRIHWAQMIAAGLDALHTPDPTMLRFEPLVHRDLKPNNILIQNNGFAQIADFGLARAVERSLVESRSAVPMSGTNDQMQSYPWRTSSGFSYSAPPYRAPEQWTGSAPADTYTDIYAFGVILSELLIGQHPFLDLAKNHSGEEWQDAHLHSRPQPLTERNPRIPNEIEHVYVECLEKNPQARPSAREVLESLQAGARAYGQRAYQVPEIFKHTPTNEASTWQNLAATYARFGYFEQALDWNDLTLRYDADNRQALLTRANLLSQKGGPEEAIQAYEKVLKVIPSTDRPMISTIYFNYATLLGKLSRFDEADELFDKAVTAVPRAADAWNNRGTNQVAWAVSELERQNTAEALRHLDLGIRYVQKARDVNSNDPQYKTTLAQFEALRDRIVQLSRTPQ